MDSFAPEFSRFWLTPDVDERSAPERPDDEKRSQLERALAELAERVTAARSIV